MDVDKPLRVDHFSSRQADPRGLSKLWEHCRWLERLQAELQPRLPQSLRNQIEVINCRPEVLVLGVYDQALLARVRRQADPLLAQVVDLVGYRPAQLQVRHSRATSSPIGGQPPPRRQPPAQNSARLLRSLAERESDAEMRDILSDLAKHLGGTKP